MLRLRFLPFMACAGISISLGGCGLLLGLDEFTDQPPGGQGGQGGEGGAAMVCAPNTEEACYAGPEGTEGVGQCKGGTRTCDAEGTAWGACAGEVLPAVEQCVAPADENCDSYDCIVWAVAYPQEGSFEPYALASDPDGNVLAGGFFSAAMTVNNKTFAAAGSTDGLLMKLSPAGDPLWAIQVGDIFDDVVAGVASDSQGNVILVGRTYAGVDFGGGPLPGGLYVVKLSPEGEHIWSTGFGGSGFLKGVAIDAHDDVIVVGAFSGSIDDGQGPVASAGGMDIVAAKLNGQTGSATDPGAWVRTIGTTLDQAAWDVAVDGSDNIFMVGYFAGNFDFGGFGGMVVGQGGDDGFIAKLTPGGSTSWVRTVGDSADQQALGVAVDAMGQPYVAGEFEGTISGGGISIPSAGQLDAFLLKYNVTGSLLWGKSFGDAQNQGARGVALDPSGDIVLAGYAGGAIDFGGGPVSAAGDLDAFVAKLSPEGAHVWSRLLGGAEEEIVWAVATSPNGETLTANTTRAASVDFGTGPLVESNATGRRLIVAKLGM